MPVSNMQQRVEVGIFNATSKARYFKKNSLRVAGPVFCFFSFGFRFVFILLFLFVYFYSIFIGLSPGPKNRNSCYKFSICHWNLNSITTHNFAKVNQLQAHNAIHDFDLICLSESYLDSPVSFDNDNLYAKDYKLVRADHPGNVKRGVVCVYFKESLSVSCLLKPYLEEWLIFEVSINSKRCYVVSMYRSPSQISDYFNSFTTNLEELNIVNSTQLTYLVVIRMLY